MEKRAWHLFPFFSLTRGVQRMNIVSSCLIGTKCRYDGKSKKNEDMILLVKKGEAIPLCPEQLGGLPTPRLPAEIQKNNLVINIKGEDVSKLYTDGAKEALRIAKLVKCQKAYLKSKSPMCGCGKIYDGSFSSRLISGDGIFSQLLKRNNIEVVTTN